MPVPLPKAESKPGNWITLTVMINYRKAKEIISLNMEFFEKVATTLAKKRLLSAVDIKKIKSECKITLVTL